MAKRICLNESSVKNDGLDPLYACPQCGHPHFAEENECENCWCDLREDQPGKDSDEE